jgi:hypothetical protein
MAEEIKFIEFSEVPNAPRISVPADLSDEDIKEFLKSDKFENAMFEQGFNFKYGLQPVDMLEMQNLDDGSVKAGLKGGWDSLKAIGQGTLAGFWDFIGAKENQAEALKIADQYMLDRSAHIFRVNEEGKLLPRINTIEDIINDEEQLTAFTKYVKYQFGNAAATSVPAIIAGIVGGGVGMLAGPGGAVAGSMGAVALSGWLFGLGDTYLAQAEELGPEGDPNVYLSMALGIPYGAVEMIGIGGVVPTLIKTFGGRQAAAKAVKEGIMQQVKQGTRGNLKKVPGMFAKGILKTGLEEGLAEAVQETLNRTAAGVAGGINFENLYSDKEFLKQLGEAAAAGFFGGWGFGVINPAAQTIKMIGQGTGPMGVKGGGMVSNLNVDSEQPAFVDKGFTMGDIVSVENRFEPDIDADVPLFGKKPKFKILGTGIIDGTEQYILQAEDLPAAIEFVPTTSHALINLEQPTPTAGNEETEENYTYAPLEEGESTYVNEDLRKQYSASKKALVETGYMNNAKDETTDTYLGGREKVINGVVNRIESARVQQKVDKNLLTEEQKTEMRNEGQDPEEAIDPINSLFKKYDRFEGEELAAEVDKDYAFWRDLELIDQAEGDAQENNFADQEKDITRLGYNIGDRGKDYINNLRKNVTSTKKGKSTEGRDRLNDIIKNNIPFSSVPALYGGPETVVQIVGEKETITEPLTAQQKASLTGDKLIPIMQYHPALLKETITFEDLYVIPVNTRMRMILELADALDSGGWKRKGLKNYPLINSERKALQDKVNAARHQFGMLSDVYKQARQELKDFNNTGEHLLRADVRMGDIVETFRLHNILSPTAIRAAERNIRKIQADSRYASKDPAVRNPLVSELLAYEALILSAHRSRKQINELLKSLSLEPILEAPMKGATTWNTLTLTKIKTTLTKLRNKLNQTEPKVKRTPIKSEHVRLQVTELGQDPEPSLNMDFELDVMSIMQAMRDILNKYGLNSVDLAILDSIQRRLEFGKVRQARGEYREASYEAYKAFLELTKGLEKANAIDMQKAYADLKPILTLNMIKIAFDMNEYEGLTPEEQRKMVARTFNTLHHETIHALRNMGMFTKAEWRVLIKEADDKWIDEFNIKAIYPNGNLSLWREEAIAEAFGTRAFNTRYSQKSLIERAFIRIKAFLLALASALKMHGYLTSESIFNHIEAGIVGQRNKIKVETADIYRWKDIEKMTLVNPHGTIIMSNNLLDTPENIAYQKRVIGLMTGEQVIPLREYNNLVKQGYIEKDLIPKVTNINIFTDGDGTRHQGGPEGPVVPPLSLFEGVLFEQQRVTEAIDLYQTQVNLFEKQGQDSRISGLEIIKIGKPNPSGLFGNTPMGARYIEAKDNLNKAERTKDEIDIKAKGMMDEKFWSEQKDETYNVNFSIKADEIRWSTTAEEAMGMTGMYDEYFSMYTHMTPDQFLSLAPSLTTPIADMTRKKSIEAITKGIKKGKKVAPPFLTIEISQDGRTAKVVNHEGRHRATVAKYINGVQSTLPVAIRFVLKESDQPFGVARISLTRESENNAYKNNKLGRQDPTHRAVLNKWLTQGTLSNQDFNTTQNASQVIDKVYQSFEVTEGNDFNFSNPYIDYNNPTVRYSIGDYTEPEINMNRQEKRNAVNQLDKAVDDSTEIFAKPGGTATIPKISAFDKILGHARSIAKLNTPFTFLYNTFMNMTRKSRSLQQAFTEILARRYMQVIQDPIMKDMLAKAMIIAQMNDLMDMKVDAQGRLTFVAKEDGGAADLSVKQGEIIVLEGDVARAFLDVHKVFQEVNNEYLKSEIAREHVPDLLKALDLMRRYFPMLPELRTVFNFEGLTQEEISARLENLNYTQIKFITTSIENIMIMRTQMDGNVAQTINTLLGTKDAGLNKLLNTAGSIASLNRKMYVPLSRFGDIFIAVHKTVTVKDAKGKEEEVEQLIWYQQFETMAEANAARDGIRLKFPDATISQPAVQTIEELKSIIEKGERKGKKPVSLEFLSQFMSDTNARNFQEILKQLRQTLTDRNLNKDVIGIKQFYTSRDKSVGAEGVPGYSADFPRSIMQFLMVASNSLARNRYANDKNAAYTETIEHALEHKDINLKKFTEKYYTYVEDPVQEFSNLRRAGFWWYLGGNVSSAILQTMSMVQFTGPLLSQMAGTVATVKELGKAFAHASNMVVHGVMGERQYQDAFLDFNKLPEGPIKEALMRAIADGTIKQGQALLEAGIIPSMGGGLVGSQRARNKAFRTFENIVIGGTFNTFEAASRITAFIATYNLAVNDPKVLDQADLLYGDDLDYQNQMNEHGRTPEALARFMTEETFGVYGKENRQWLGRNIGSLAALFMTYMTQMMGLMYRMLNPPVLKRKAGGGFTIGVANPAKTRLQNKVGRRAFARIMLLMLMTGGLFGLPGGEDAEDLYDLTKKMITGIESDIRSEFRNMLYEAGWGPTMIESMEKGLISSMLNIDVQRRVGFGVMPWSQQVRALINMAGIPTGARAEEFLGAPGSIFTDAIRGLTEQGIRENQWGKALQQMSPTFIRNIMKAAEYSPYGNGFATTGYGQVLTHDIDNWDIFWQAVGFTPTAIAKEREALFQERKLDKGMNLFRQRKNAQISNAYRDIIIGGMKYDADLINEGQQKLADIFADVMEHNANQLPHLLYIPDMRSLRLEAMKAVYPGYRIATENKKLVGEKMKIRLALGLN